MRIEPVEPLVATVISLRQGRLGLRVYPAEVRDLVRFARCFHPQTDDEWIDALSAAIVCWEYNGVLL